MLEIETNRLLLRNLKQEDTDDLFEILSDEQTCLDDGGFHAFEQKDEAFLDLFSIMLEQRRYVIVLKETHKMIGTIHLQTDDRAVDTFELGFVLNRRYRRKGYATEALSALIQTYFDKDLVEMFTITHFKNNEKCKQLVKKLGFVYEGISRKAINHVLFGPSDLVCYYLEKK